jgi:hypothetical protein
MDGGIDKGKLRSPRMPPPAVRTQVLVVEHARLHQPEARDRDGCTAAAETSQLPLSDGAGVGDLLVVLLDHTREPEATD